MHTIDLKLVNVHKIYSNWFQKSFLSEASQAIDLKAEQMTSRTQTLTAKQ